MAANPLPTTINAGDRRSWGLGITLATTTSTTTLEDKPLLRANSNTARLSETTIDDDQAIHPGTAKSSGQTLFQRLANGLTTLLASEANPVEIRPRSQIQDMIESFYLSQGRTVPDWVHDPPADPPLPADTPRSSTVSERRVAMARRAGQRVSRMLLCSPNHHRHQNNRVGKQPIRASTFNGSVRAASAAPMLLPRPRRAIESVGEEGESPESEERLDSALGSPVGHLASEPPRIPRTDSGLLSFSGSPLQVPAIHVGSLDHLTPLHHSISESAISRSATQQRIEVTRRSPETHRAKPTLSRQLSARLMSPLARIRSPTPSADAAGGRRLPDSLMGTPVLGHSGSSSSLSLRSSGSQASSTRSTRSTIKRLFRRGHKR